MRHLITVLIIVLTAFQITAAPLLPGRFILAIPKEPRPGTKHSDFSKKKERPKMGKSARTTLRINLDTTRIIPHKLLSIFLGLTPCFMPGEYYQIYLPGHKAGHKNFIIALFGRKKIIFKATKDDLENIYFSSFNYPGYIISRDDENIVVTDHNGKLQYIFFSDDGGYTWKIDTIRDLEFKRIKIRCKYNDEELLSKIVLPNKEYYEILYDCGLPIKITDPNKLVTKISWQGKENISNIKTWIPTNHPFYPETWPGSKPRPILIRNIFIESDSAGRITSLINTDGEKFSAEYRANSDKEKKTDYLCGILTLPNGRKKFTRRLWNNNLPKTLRISSGFLTMDEKGNEVFDELEKYYYKEKAHVFVPYTKEVNGKITNIDRNHQTMISTGESTSSKNSKKSEYYEHGLCKREIFPDNTFVSYEYDEEKRMVKKTNEEGIETKYSYNKEGWLEQVDENGKITQYVYNKKGFPIQTILPDTEKSHCFEWDKLFRMKSHTFPDKKRVEYSYIEGTKILRKTKTFLKDGKTDSKTFKFSPRGFLTKVNWPDKTIERYYYNSGNLVTYTDRASNVTQYGYNSAGRKIYEIAPDKEKIKYFHDKNGNLIKVVTPNGATTKYDFNKYNKMVKKNNPDGSWITYDFDSLGRIIREKYSDRTYRTFTYDLRGRLQAISGNHEDGLIIKYNKTGKIISKKWIPLDNKRK